MLIPQFSVERVIRYSYSYLLFVNYTTICTSFIVTHPTTNQPLCVCVGGFNRVVLGARFQPGNHGGYTARVDGVLWTKSVYEILAIVETKRRSRNSTFKGGWIKRNQKCRLKLWRTVSI